MASPSQKTKKPMSAAKSSIEVTPPPRLYAAIAGILGAAVALAIGEFISGLSRAIPSMVVSAGDWVIDSAPGAVERWAIDTLGTADKPALVIGTIIITLLIGAGIGIAARVDQRITGAVFAVFGLLGWWFLARNPLTDTSATWLVAFVAAAGGYAAFRLLYAVSQFNEQKVALETPTNPFATRRSFFAWGGAAGLTAVALTGLGRQLRGRAAVDDARNEIVIDTTTDAATIAADIETFDDIEGIASYITDSTGNNFYRIDSALTIPQVDPDTWSLKITGLVDNPVEFTLADIQAMDLEDHVVTISCVSNEVGGGLVGNALWTGVPLTKLLEIAGVQPEATQFVSRSVDGWTAGFPPEILQDGRTALLAIGMNGEPLPVRHGFPARIIVAGIYGYVSATKWVEEINLTAWDDFDGYWIPRGWAKEGPIKTQSRIDVPRSRTEISSGLQPIAGVAWAPTRGISMVEVKIGDEDWQEATIAESVTDETWVQWMLEWDAPPGDHLIQVRATDGDGELQALGPKRVDPDGAEGWHIIGVRVSSA